MRAKFSLSVLVPTLLLGLLSACAASGTERVVAPFVSLHSTAGGGVETEALGGAVRVRYPRPEIDGKNLWSQWAVRPLYIRDREASGDMLARFLTPFGNSKRRGDEYLWQLLPITRYESHVDARGLTEWTLLTLPGIYWSKRSDGRIVRAWFPFGGVMEEFLSFDRLVFVLFPLWMRTERAGRVTNHVLFPIFSWTQGTGGPSGRFWPFYGRSAFEGRYERFFVLWPFYHWNRNRLDLPPDKQETQWLLFPLLGRTKRADYRATTVLWPFFGWASDPATGFRSFDAPFPLVRFLRAPQEDIERTRVWPLFSHYHGDGLDSTWYLWPIFNRRREIYDQGEKTSTYIIPFWQSWKRIDDDAGRFEFQKLWPLYVREGRDDTESHLAFPALNPLWRTPEIDEMYAWLWELYTRDVNHDQVRERSWLGLYRREKDRYEDRRSFTFVWASRSYRENGARVRERSLLFGLFRWRTHSERGTDWLAPALPGPGWPLERVGSSATVGAPE